MYPWLHASAARVAHVPLAARIGENFAPLRFTAKLFCFVGLWVLRELLKTQARLSRLFLSPGDQYLLSYDVFADEFSAPSLQNRANIVYSTKPPIKKKKNPQPKTLKI
jgi:hypothetical protein